MHVNTYSSPDNYIHRYLARFVTDVLYTHENHNARMPVRLFDNGCILNTPRVSARIALDVLPLVSDVSADRLKRLFL